MLEIAPASQGLELASVQTRLLHVAHSLCEATETWPHRKMDGPTHDEIPIYSNKFRPPTDAEVMVTARYAGFKLVWSDLVRVTFDMLDEETRFVVSAGDTRDVYDHVYYEESLDRVRELAETPSAVAVSSYVDVDEMERRMPLRRAA